MVAIAIVGPGAIGGTVAAELSRGDVHAITVCARTPFDHLEVDTPTGRLVATPRVLTDPGAAEPVDWVLVATKAYDHAATAIWLRALVSATTRVAILQNGVEHVERFAPYVPAASIVPVIVNCPAERTAPGRVLLRRAAALQVPDSHDGHAFVSLFAHCELPASTATDFKSESWRKLCLNCAGAVSAILLRPAGIARLPAVADLMRDIASEARAVGIAEGAVLGEDVIEDAIAAYRAAAAESINSLHADRLAGRPMEVDARNGAVVRLGAKHGIATPLNRAIVAMLDALQPA